MLCVPMPTVLKVRETWYNEPLFMSNTLKKDNGFGCKALREAFTAADVFTGELDLMCSHMVMPAALSCNISCHSSTLALSALY